MSEELNKAAGTRVTFVVPDTESLGRLETMEPKLSLNTAYRLEEEWQKLINKPIRCYYMGMKEIPNPEGKLVLCGIFVSSTEVFLAGGIMLIDRLRDLPPTDGKNKTAIQLTYLGTRPTKSDPNKKLLTFDIQKLG
jgi:hypothetical protein